MTEAARDDRRQRAIQMRIAGATFTDIGKALGITKSRAHALVRSELADMAANRADSRESLRTLMGERYNAILKRLWMESGVVRRQDGSTDLRVDVIDRILRVMESMTRLHGVEAVTQAEEEALVLRASGSRLAMLMMKFVPEEQRDAMVKELERVLAEKEAQGDIDDDEREIIDGAAQPSEESDDV
jgi:hypothetical protein